jgi:hypothetical protein
MKIGVKLGQHLSLTLKVCNWRLAERLNFHLLFDFPKQLPIPDTATRFDFLNNLKI